MHLQSWHDTAGHASARPMSSRSWCSGGRAIKSSLGDLREDVSDPLLFSLIQGRSGEASRYRIDRYLNNRVELDHYGVQRQYHQCVGLRVARPLPGIVQTTMNCETFPSSQIETDTLPPIAAGCISSSARSPSGKSSKTARPDGTSGNIQRHSLYLLACP
jgi:hypothetical protein